MWLQDASSWWLIRGLSQGAWRLSRDIYKFVKYSRNIPQVFPTVNLFRRTFSVFTKRSLEVLEKFKIPATIRLIFDPNIWQLSFELDEQFATHWGLFGELLVTFRWMFAEYSRDNRHMRHLLTK